MLFENYFACTYGITFWSLIYFLSSSVNRYLYLHDGRTLRCIRRWRKSIYGIHGYNFIQ